MSDVKYYYAMSEDCECWTYDNYNDLFGDKFGDELTADNGDVVTIYMGESAPAPVFSGLYRVIIDQLDERLYEEVGEIAEGWPEALDAKQGASLDDAIKSWFIENDLMPTQFKIINIVPVRFRCEVKGHDVEFYPVEGEN